MLLLAVTLLGGCATVPTKGTIRQGERAGSAPDLGGVGVEAKPPRANVGDMSIVSGFLEAMSDSQAYDVARQYMTPAAAGSWKPESQTVVYDQQPDSLTRKADGIPLTAKKIATINDRGEWIPAPAGAKADFFFKLKKVNDQLRVDPERLFDSSSPLRLLLLGLGEEVVDEAAKSLRQCRVRNALLSLIEFA